MTSHSSRLRPDTSRNCRIAIACAAALSGLFAARLYAGPGPVPVPINVPNFSFESPNAPTTSPFVNINVDSWQKIAEPASFVPLEGDGIAWVQTAGLFYAPGEYANQDGNQLGYILAAPQVTLFQTLSTAFTVGQSYSLTVGVFGKPGLADGSTLQLSLFYIDSLNNEQTLAATTITYSAGAFNINEPSLALVDFSVNTGEIEAGMGAAGQPIGIQIESTIPIEDTTFVNWDIDNVRLTEVPEPGSMALMAVGLGGWLVARSRQRAVVP